MIWGNRLISVGKLVDKVGIERMAVENVGGKVVEASEDSAEDFGLHSFF